MAPPASLFPAPDSVPSIRIADGPWCFLLLTLPPLNLPVQSTGPLAESAGHDDSPPRWHQLPAAMGYARAPLLLRDGGVGDLGAADDLRGQIAILRGR